MAVHPTGSMALTGGLVDGKLKLWDLTKGRLAYNFKIQPKRTVAGKTVYDAVNCIVWTAEAYAFCYGNHLTVKDVDTGSDLLDVELPSKVNQVCFLQGPEGMFVASANNDGSLAVLHVDNNTSRGEVRRAIMAIEPVEGPVAGEERFKCLQQVGEYHVVTANSAGVVSLMDLSGAVRMIMVDDDDAANDNDEDEKESDNEEEDPDADEEEELAVDIIDSVQLGSGNRVTCLVAWSTTSPLVDDNDDDEEASEGEEDNEHEEMVALPSTKKDNDNDIKRKRESVQLDSSALANARDLVASAKKIREKRQKKSKKNKKTKR